MLDPDTCAKSGKNCYTKKQLEYVVPDREIKSGLKLWTYKCDFCKSYHLTKMKQKTKRGENG